MNGMNFNRILTLIASLIFISIVALSAVYVVKNGMRPAMRPVSPEQRNNERPDYINLGQLRTSTKKDENGERSVIVFTAALSYDTTDLELYEDIKTSLYRIKPIFTDYFKAFTKAQILEKGELKTKSEIKQKINMTLVHGKINDIFFEEFQYID